MLYQQFEISIVQSSCVSINTSSLTESYIIFTLKMESVSENTIFGKVFVTLSADPGMGR